MALNLGSVFSDVDTILNQLLSKYTKMRLIGFDQAENQKRYYLTDNITKGFYYKARKQPITGKVVERLKIVPEDSNIDTAIRKAKLIELKDDDDNFVRFSFETYKEPNPPTYEWLLDIVPNRQDTGVIEEI